MTQKKIALFVVSVLSSVLAIAGGKPVTLRVDLIERTDVVYINGYATSMSLEEIPQAIESVQFAAIASEKPRFSWAIDGGNKSDVIQTAYRIEVYRMVAVEQEGKQVKGQAPKKEKQIVWDSGKVDSGRSSAIEYAGSPLVPETVYYWTVSVWDNKGSDGETSAPKAFRTASVLSSDAISIEPLVKNDQYPVSLDNSREGVVFLDFGKAAFGQVRLTLTARTDSEKVVLHLGERIKEGRVDREPFGSCRYRRIELPLKQGTHTYQPKILPDFRNTHGDAVLMPDYIGEVMPFRYMEVEGYKGEISKTDVVRMYVHHPSNEFSSDFRSSSDILNQVWDLCKYSMTATSFIGYHIDGDRERIPYECDGLVNQLCCYGSDDVYTLTRRSIDHLLDHPTWPTEWILQTVLMAWYDYLYTGDTRLLEARYELLGNHTLLTLKGSNGLISTKENPQDEAFLASINRTQEIRDIVDWPQGKGSFGLPDSHPGEADYFEFTSYNTVVNAYHCEALALMGEIASAIGREKDAAEWLEAASAAKAKFNKLLLNTREGRYRDGVGSQHSALHSNMFPLTFGLVPVRQASKVADFVESRGMACSIGNAIFLLRGLYDSFKEDYALSLMTAEHDRGWYNTILSGSTMTFEAWDDKYKGNQDWNHAWGGGLADILPHKLLGVEPLSPGWDRIRIRPQVASLANVEGKVPTIKGPVTVSVKNEGGKYSLDVVIPSNTKAQIWVPAEGKGSLMVNGVSVKAVKDPSGRFFVLDDVGSGKKSLKVGLL